MNNLRINITIDSLTRLTPVSANTYHLVVRFFNNSDGSPINNPNLPNPYLATVTTTVTTFHVDVPITDAVYNIPGIKVKLFADSVSNCCFGIGLFDLVNSSSCSFVVDATFIQCNGVIGVNLSGLSEPASDIFIGLSSTNENLFKERNGQLFTFNKQGDSPHVSTGLYRIQMKSANNCISYDDIQLDCAWPTFDLTFNPTYCSAGTLVPPSVKITNAQNATRYRVCYSPVFSCEGDCTSSDGVINSSGDTLITLIPGTAGQRMYYTIRVYNGNDPSCMIYSDIQGIDDVDICTPAVTCPPDGTWTANLDGDYYKVTTTPSTAIPTGYLIVSKPNKYYAIDGTRLYNSDLTTYTTLTTSLWKANTATDGPMNRCAVWTNQEDSSFPVNQKPLNMWIGFSKCLTGLTPGKQYYVGLEADNAFQLIVDGKVIFQQLGSDTHFRTWKVFPIIAKKSSMLIAMQAINTEYAAGFGAEIYDNTAAQIAAASNVSNLNIIFTSSSKVGGKFDIGGLQNGVQYGYACPSGYTYNPCTNVCEKVDYCHP